MTAASFTLTRDPRGKLVFRAAPETEPVPDVRLARCFLWMERHRYISVRDRDGQELTLIRDLAEVAPEVRAVIEQELAAREFVPRVLAVQSVRERFGVTSWTVQTDRGPFELQIQHREDVRELSPGHVILRDHAGGVFDIPDLSKLDPASQHRVLDHLA